MNKINGFKTIFFKELKRYLTDYRMLLALFLPGVLILLLYLVMGNLISISSSTTFESITSYTYKIALSSNYNDNSNVSNILLETFSLYLKEEDKDNNLEYYYFDIDDKDNNSSNEIELYKDKLKEGNIDLLIIYTDNFEGNLLFNENSNNSNSNNITKPNITILYNGEKKESTYLYNIISELSSSLYSSFTFNTDNEGNIINPNISNKDYTLQSIISLIFPFLTISLLFSSIISIAPEAIAGEKERNTLSLILLTPIKRSDIALAKIASLSIISFLSGISSFLGVILSLPSLFNGFNITITIFSSPLSFILLFLLIISALILFLTLGLLVSSFAKSIKEATSYLTPLMTILMVISLLPGFLDLSPIYYSFIPLLNIVSSISFIIKGIDISLFSSYFIITIIINILFSLLIIYLISKIFNKEKIMFTK